MLSNLTKKLINTVCFHPSFWPDDIPFYDTAPKTRPDFRFLREGALEKGPVGGGGEARGYHEPSGSVRQTHPPYHCIYIARFICSAAT